jgi:hypothetical protein
MARPDKVRCWGWEAFCVAQGSASPASHVIQAGWLRKQGHSFHEGWARRYVAIKEGSLCYYARYEDFNLDQPLNCIQTLLVTVRIGSGGAKAKNHQFQLVTPRRNYEVCVRVFFVCGFGS